jgi:hypothetical protein
MIHTENNSSPASTSCRQRVSGITSIRYPHSQKFGNPHELKVFGSAKTKDAKPESQIRLRIPSSEGGKP